MNAARVVEKVMAVMRRPRSRRAQGLIVAVALVVLTVSTYAAVRRVPAGTELAWWPVALLIVVGTPWSVVLLSTEVGVTGRLVGVDLPAVVRVRVAVLGTAFNLLPIPGAAVTRLDALIGAGARGRAAATSVVTVGLVWVSMSAIIAAVAVAPTSWLWVALAVGGLVVGAGAAGLLRRALPSAAGGDIARLVLVELGFSLTAAARFALSLLALGEAFAPRTALTMAASASLSSAIGIVPGGLGVKEALATAFGAAAGVPAAVALLAALVNRVAELVGALVTGLVVLPFTHRAPVERDLR